MILNSQRTMYGIDLQMDMLFHRQYTPIANTTLNEKFGVATNIPIPEGTYPRLDYLVIGVGGTTRNDTEAYKFSRHSVIDGALFEHVPFIVRPIDNDLSPADRAKYRMRTQISKGGTAYWAYYMKKFTDYTITNGITEITTIGDVSTLKYRSTTDTSILQPVPRRIDVDTYLIPTESTYIAKTAKVEFALYADDIAEIKSAMEILRDDGVTPLTEIGLCTGIDATDAVTGTTEVNNSVVNYFVEIDFDTQVQFESGNNYLRAIELGGIEPLVL